MKKVFKGSLAILIVFIIVFSSTGTILAESTSGFCFNHSRLYKLQSAPQSVPITFEAEIYFPLLFPADNRGGAIFGNYVSGGSPAINLEIYYNGAPRLFYEGTDYTKEALFDQVNVYTGSWTDLAVVIDEGKGKAYCYVDGKFKQSCDFAIDTANLTENIYSVGGDSRAKNECYFKGVIRSLAIYSDMRTGHEIKKDMKSLDKSDLLVAYDLSDNGLHYPNALIDLSDNGNNAIYNVVSNDLYLPSIESDFDYAYSFAVVGDTQYVSRDYPDQYSKIYDYILENVESKKIEMVLGLGDITDLDMDEEWDNAIDNFSRLNGKVPYTIVRGNHDSLPKYRKAVEKIGYPDRMDGIYGDETENAYQELVIGKVKYLILTLDIYPNDDEIKWATRVIEDHPEHNVIIATHSYITSDGEPIEYTDEGLSKPSAGCNYGPDMWEKLFSKHSNIVMVLGGHSISEKVLVRQDQGDNGNSVTSMLIDFQSVDAWNGPAGMVNMFYFSEDGSKLRVETYSTVKEAYYKAENQFEMEIDVVGSEPEAQGSTFDEELPYTLENVAENTPYTFESEIFFPADYSAENAGGVIFGNYKDSNTKGINMEIFANGNPGLRWVNGTSGENSVIFNNVNVYTGQWLDLAISVDATNNKANCYIDGELKQTCDFVVDTNVLCDNAFVLGGDLTTNNENYFKGSVKNIAVYSDMRTAEEILSDVNQLNKNDLIAAYDLSGLYAEKPEVYEDLSDNGNNAKCLNNILYNIAKETNSSNITFNNGVLNYDAYNNEADTNYSANGIAFGQATSDFEATFDFTPNSDRPWSDTTFQFGVNEDMTYGLRIHGQSAAAEAHFNGMLMVVRNEAYKTPIVKVDTVPLVAGTTYSIKVSVVERCINVWYAEKSAGFSATPTLTATLDATYKGGMFKFRTYGGEFGISNLNIVDVGNMSIEEVMALKANNPNIVYSEENDAVTFIKPSTVTTVMSKYFGESCSDFQLQFDYKVESTQNWGNTYICFRGPTGEEGHYQKYYALVINGNSTCNGAIQIVKEEGRANPIVQSTEMKLETSKTYSFKILTVDDVVSVWCALKGESFAETPLLTATLDGTYPEGKFKIKTYGAHFSLSNITIGKPEVSLKDIAERSESSAISYSEENDSLTFIKPDPIGTVMTKYFGDSLSDFEMEFEYKSESAQPWGNAYFCFRGPADKETSYQNYYALCLNGPSNGLGYIQIVKDENRANPIAETNEFLLKDFTTYKFKIVTIDNEVSVWCVEKGRQYDEPILTATLDDTYSKGQFKIKTYGSHFTISNLTVKEPTTFMEDLAERSDRGDIIYTDATDSITFIKSNPIMTAITHHFGDITSDFQLQFDYKTESVQTWSNMYVCFRTVIYKEAATSGYYALCINGSSTYGGAIQIVKDEGRANPIASNTDFKLEDFTTYTFKIVSVDNEVTVWCAEKGQEFGDAILNATLDDGVYPSGRFKFKTYGGHFTISNLSVGDVPQGPEYDGDALRVAGNEMDFVEGQKYSLVFELEDKELSDVCLGLEFFNNSISHLYGAYDRVELISLDGNVGNKYYLTFIAPKSGKAGVSLLQSDLSLEIIDDIMAEAEIHLYDTANIGDTNLDGSIDARDIVRLKKCIAYEWYLGGDYSIASNINTEDDSINALDVSALRKAFLG